MTTTNPRGEPSWPNWRDAEPGTRVRHVKTGRKATFVKPSSCRNNGAIVDWDAIKVGNTVFRSTRGYVVSPAYDLEVIPEGEE